MPAGWLPDGTYYWRVALLAPGPDRPAAGGRPGAHPRSPPARHARVPVAAPRAGRRARRSIRITGTENRITRVTIYRTDRPGTPQPLTSFKVPGRSSFTWNGRLGRRQTPAPAGTYLVGLYVADQACNVGRFPAALPPEPGTTPHAGVSIRYLAAEPPPAASRPARTRDRAGRRPAPAVHLGARRAPARASAAAAATARCCGCRSPAAAPGPTRSRCAPGRPGPPFRCWPSSGRTGRRRAAGARRPAASHLAGPEPGRRRR